MCTQTETYSGVLERLRKTGTYHLGVNTYEYVARLKLSYTSMATPGEVGAAIANACEGRGEYAIHPIHREVTGSKALYLTLVSKVENLGVMAALEKCEIGGRPALVLPAGFSNSRRGTLDGTYGHQSRAIVTFHNMFRPGPNQTAAQNIARTAALQQKQRDDAFAIREKALDAQLSRAASQRAEKKAATLNAPTARSVSGSEKGLTITANLPTTSAEWQRPWEARDRTNGKRSWAPLERTKAPAIAPASLLEPSPK